jgi:hypothetical protein
MKSWLCCIGMVAVAIFTGAACGDDSGSTGGSGASGGSGGTGGSGGSGGSGAEDGGGNPDAGKSQTEGCVTIYDADKINYMGTAAPVYTCTADKSTKYPDGPNSCRNETDCAIINTGLVRNIVKECALSCLEKEPPAGTPEPQRTMMCNVAADCNATCVKGATSMKIMPPGISDACGRCYTDISHCSVAFCLMQCFADADAIECVKCQFEWGCRVPFERCSGVDRQQ